MQYRKLVGAVGVLWLVAGASLTSAETKSAATEEQLVEGIACKNGKESRRLEVHTKDAGCTLQYTKGGKAQEVANSRHGVELCKSKLVQVRTTLEKGGYKCE